MGNRERPAGKRGLLTGFAVMAGMVVMSSVAWACTANPTDIEELDAIFFELHCATHQPPPSEYDDPALAPVGIVAHGSGTFYPGKVVDVYQDDDDTNSQAGAFQSAVAGCDGDDPARGTVTYGQQTIGNSRVGTGSAVLEATDGPGLYGVCLGPPETLSALGQFVFL